MEQQHGRYPAVRAVGHERFVDQRQRAGRGRRRSGRRQRPRHRLQQRSKTTVATLPGVGYYINDAGQAGGTENDFRSGFVWSQNARNGWAAGVTNLPNMCEVLGISQNGQYAVGQDTSYTNGVLYNNVTAAYTTIAPGTSISVNNNGWVGGSTAIANYADTEVLPSAWLWDGTTLHTTDLAAMLPTGYTTVSVMAVNDSDDILMGGADGDQWNGCHAFLLTPVPEPSTITLLSCLRRAGRVRLARSRTELVKQAIQSNEPSIIKGHPEVSYFPSRGNPNRGSEHFPTTVPDRITSGSACFSVKFLRFGFWFGCYFSREIGLRRFFCRRDCYVSSFLNGCCLYNRTIPPFKGYFNEGHYGFLCRCARVRGGRHGEIPPRPDTITGN